MPMAMETQGAAATRGRGRFRVGDDDRQRVTDLLKTAFTQGRLTQEELDERTRQASAARTYSDLDALTEDIHVRHWRLARAIAISVGCLALAFVAAYSGNLIDNAWHGAGPGPEHGWTRLLATLAYIAVITAFIVTGRAVATTIQERNARRQHPRTG